MFSLDSIVEIWFTKAIDIYPRSLHGGMMRVSDRFRNPVAYNLRESLEVLARELAGDMNLDAIRVAMDGIVRVRAVQECTPEQAVRFAEQLRDVIREQHAEASFPDCEQRVCLLMDLASEQYAACRKEVAMVGSRAKQRLQALEPWMRQVQ